LSSTWQLAYYPMHTMHIIIIIIIIIIEIYTLSLPFMYHHVQLQDTIHVCPPSLSSVSAHLCPPEAMQKASTILTRLQTKQLQHVHVVIQNSGFQSRPETWGH